MKDPLEGQETMHRVWRGLGMLLLWLAFVTLLLQGAGYVLFNHTGFRAFAEYGYPTGIYVSHPRLGFIYAPGFSGHFYGAAYQHIPIEINAHGFRDKPFQSKRPPTARVLMVGDSVVFGAGVAAQARFTALLDAAWQPGAEMLNLGVNAYTFGHYVTLAELDFLGLQPDYVLLGFTLNDIKAPGDDMGRGRLEQYGVGARPDWYITMERAARTSYAWRFVQEVWLRVRLGMMSAQASAEYHTRWMHSVVDFWKRDVERARLEEEVKRWQALLAARSVPFGIVLFPELNALRGPQEFGYPRQAARALFERLRVAYCDPYARFAGQADLPALFLANDGVHYSPAGHALIGEAVRECAVRGLLPGAPGSPAQSSAGRGAVAAGTPLVR